MILGEETSDPVNRRWTGHLLYRLLCEMTHHLIGVSPAVRDYLVDKIRLPANKVTLINNGVAQAPPATAEQVHSVHEAYGLTTEHFVIGTVGRLFDHHKRVSDLIRALPLILAFCPDARLLIVGTGPEENMLREQAIALGVARQVLLAGYQVDPQPFYAVMDVFALASAYEAFGLVLVEAMLAGLPVVATRVGGIPTVVSAGETGFLVEPGQPPALADALLTLQRSAELRRALGQKGRARALAEFSADRYVREVDQLYQRLLSERRPT